MADNNKKTSEVTTKNKEMQAAVAVNKKIKIRAATQMAEMGFSLSTIQSILDIGYNVLERALNLEFQMLDKVQKDYTFRSISKKSPYSLKSYIYSYTSIYECTFFYSVYKKITPDKNEIRPNPLAIYLAYNLYINTVHDRLKEGEPFIKHINQAYNLVNQIIQGIIQIEECSACGRMYVTSDYFKGYECPLCRLKKDLS